MKFNITLSPQRRDDTLELEKQGTTLIINGTEYDFLPLVDGASISAKAIDCDFIVSDAVRNGDSISLTMLLPNSAEATEAARFPQPITVSKNGKVALPE